jgi:hypothetical protein
MAGSVGECFMPGKHFTSRAGNHQEAQSEGEV